MTSIHFLGAAGLVTGSRHLVEHKGRRVLLDCGLFQGRKAWRSRNWDDFPVPPQSIDAVVLSHAHIDHTGWLPRLVKQGFAGPVFATPATRDLLAIMLPDSGRIQEEDARYANKRKFSKHDPALPLYSEKDAVRTIPRIRTFSYGVTREVAPGFSARFHRAGHILGSASVALGLEDGPDVVFSGDLGRYDVPILCDPAAPERATYLLVESTYGNRRHADASPDSRLAEEVHRTVKEGGVLLIPSFAIGRAQHLLYLLRQLQDQGEIPELPIFLDSPMACSATPLFLMHREEHDEEMAALVAGGDMPLYPRHVEFTRKRKQSQAINGRKGPMIIISASGMATGGRVLHHLKRWLPVETTSVLFVGYQATGTRGWRLMSGEKSVRIHGRDVPVRARIGQVYGFSGHGDQDELARWMRGIRPPPRRTFCVHGEPEALEAQRARLEAQGWPAYVPAYRELVELE